MSWMVQILGTAAYYATDEEGKIPLSALPDSGWVSLRIYGANTELALDSETLRYSSGVARVLHRHAIRRAVLTSAPLRFPTDDTARRQLEEVLAQSRYLWIDWGDYPGRLCPAEYANAVELESLEVEHNWETGTKTLRVALLVTRR